MNRFTTIKPPGRFVQNIKIGPQPIEGVSTVTVAFLGEAQTGPTIPTLITSWKQYQDVFGGFFGADKYLPYSVEGFFGNGGQSCYICNVIGSDYSAALANLEAVEDISILYSPNAQAVSGLSYLLISHCERFKRFCIFDSIKGQSPLNVTKPCVSANAALYYPWIYVIHEGQKVLVPPGGYIAGVYVFNDIQRGVHKAPANEVVNGAVDLESMVTRSQQDTLNPMGLNCICKFGCRGILVWGARTLSSDPEYKYINVKRLLIYLEKSIRKGTAWVTFELNNEATWAKVKVLTEDFLMQAWQTGMLMGAKPQEAYFVKCDRTTMTQTDIDQGNLSILIGAAIVKPAEYLILKINQTTAHQ